MDRKQRRTVEIVQTPNSGEIADLMAAQLKMGAQPTSTTANETFEPHMTSAARPQLGRRSREIPKPRPKPLEL